MPLHPIPRLSHPPHLRINRDEAWHWIRVQSNAQPQCWARTCGPNISQSFCQVTTGERKTLGPFPQPPPLSQHSPRPIGVGALEDSGWGKEAAVGPEARPSSNLPHAVACHLLAAHSPRWGKGWYSDFWGRLDPSCGAWYMGAQPNGSFGDMLSMARVVLGQGQGVDANHLWVFIHHFHSSLKSYTHFPRLL